MQEVKFQGFVDADQLIRPPAGVTLPGGEVEVTVRAVDTNPSAARDVMAETREWLLGLAREAEIIVDPLPSDLAKNHDHYAHGRPRECSGSSSTPTTASLC